MDIKKELKDRGNYAEQVVKKYFPKGLGYADTVLEAMEYSLLAGGKRIRPVLLMESCKLFGGAPDEVVEPFAAALEMIHTYSLVHDDLPAMDNDELRRGMPTTHIKYGEAMAILAGDGLLNLAYEVASESLLTGWHPDRTARAMKLLATKPGHSGMLGGQVIDLESENGIKDITEDTIIKMYDWKTSALIECAMMIGAVLAGATDEEVAETEQIARCVGRAFQIQDDILDITGDEAKLGKPLHSDEKNAKSTYVSFVGLENARKVVADYSREAISRIKVYEDKDPSNDGFLSGLFEYLIYREN